MFQRARNMSIHVRYLRTCAVILTTILLVQHLYRRATVNNNNNNNKDNKSVTKVLIVSSNPRSGSTYLAEMISGSETDSSLFFEPLRWLLKDTHDMQDGMTEDKLLLLRSFFRCQFQDYIGMMLEEFFRRLYFKRPVLGLGVEGSLNLTTLVRVVGELEESCGGSGLRVIKTIRLFLDELQDEDLVEYKVILLVRDPRAVITSIGVAVPGDFTLEQRNPDFICGKTLRDLETFQKMDNNNNNVILVQYEHLIDRWESETKRIFEDFLGMEVPVPRAAADKNDGYFGTWREPGFRHDSWKKKINPSYLRRFQKNEFCSKVMDKLGYQPI